MCIGKSFILLELMEVTEWLILVVFLPQVVNFLIILDIILHLTHFTIILNIKSKSSLCKMFSGSALLTTITMN